MFCLTRLLQASYLFGLLLCVSLLNNSTPKGKA